MGAYAAEADGDGDLAAHVPGFELAHGVGDPAQRAGPADDRHDLAGLEQLPQALEVRRGDRREQRAERLAHERRQQRRPELAIDAAEPRAALLAPDDDERAGRRERAPEMRQRTIARRVEDDVVTLSGRRQNPPACSR